MQFVPENGRVPRGLQSDGTGSKNRIRDGGRVPIGRENHRMDGDILGVASLLTGLFSGAWLIFSWGTPKRAWILIAFCLIALDLFALQGIVIAD
jgi:hypothetical protein